MEPLASPFHHFLHMAVFLAQGADQELLKREAMELQSVATTLAQEAGVDEAEARAALPDIVRAALELDQQAAATAFLDHARLLATWCGREVLQGLYHGLLQVASSDRTVVDAERFVLDEVKRLWQI